MFSAHTTDFLLSQKTPVGKIIRGGDSTFCIQTTLGADGGFVQGFEDDVKCNFVLIVSQNHLESFYGTIRTQHI